MDVGSPDRFVNRELSWLDFNERVLSMATEPGVPLLERAKFLAIFSSNLDEFFQVRVAAMRDQQAAGVSAPLPDGLTPSRQLDRVVLRVAELASRQQSIFLEHVEPELRSHGIGLCSWADLTEAERTFARDYYDERIFPVLTPLAVDPAHPFPYVSNLALSLAVMVRDPKTGDERFARVKVPTVFPRLLALPGGDRFVPVDVIIETHIGALFPGMEIADAVAFRVTRNTDLTLEDEDADDLLAAVETELRRRRFGRAVRLEVEENASPAVVDLLLDELELHRDDVTWVRGPLDLTCLWQVHALDRPELKDDPWVPVTAGRLAAAENDERSIFSVVRERALLVHHP
ncbi:MAG: polyphosphate kinase, partial [Actinomycetota bacterium]